jgi:hypothetical protein
MLACGCLRGRVRSCLPSAHLGLTLASCFFMTAPASDPKLLRRVVVPAFKVCLRFANYCALSADVSLGVLPLLRATCTMVAAVASMTTVAPVSPTTVTSVEGRGAGAGAAGEADAPSLSERVTVATLLEAVLGGLRSVVSAAQGVAASSSGTAEAVVGNVLGAADAVLALQAHAGDREWLSSLTALCRRCLAYPEAPCPATASGAGPPESAWSLLSRLLGLVLPCISSESLCEVVMEVVNIADAWAFAYAHIHTSCGSITPQQDVLVRVLLMAWTASTLRLASAPSLAVVADDAFPRRTVADAAAMCSAAEWHMVHPFERRDRLCMAASESEDSVRETRDSAVTWFVGLGDHTVVGKVLSQDSMGALVQEVKASSKVATTAGKLSPADLAGQVKVAREYHLRALAGFNAVRRQLCGAGLPVGSRAAFLGVRLEVLRCAQVVSRVVMDYTAAMDLVRACPRPLGPKLVSPPVPIYPCASQCGSSPLQHLAPFPAPSLPARGPPPRTVPGRVPRASCVYANVCWVLSLPFCGSTQLYSVRGDVELPDDSAGWHWCPDPFNTDKGGLLVPISAAGAASASITAPGLSWLTPWEARMILPREAHVLDYDCPLALDQVLVLGLELVRLLITAMATLSGVEGDKAAASGGPAPTLVEWLKDRASDVGQSLVRLCHRNRGETLLAPALERDLKKMLVRIGISTSRVQFSAEFDFDVPSVEAREQTYIEVVAVANRERFEKLTVVALEGSSSLYAREAVVDVGYDVRGDIEDNMGAMADEGTADRMQVPPLPCASAHV